MKEKVALAEQKCARCGEPVGSLIGGAFCAACLFEEAFATSDLTDELPPAAGLEFTRTFGTYELLDEIGRGGMGVIYRARQPGLERVIALKMLLAGEFAAADARMRLLREARAVAKLSHPNIVSIHEVGEHDGRAYFAMEYVPGRSLAEILQAGSVSIARIAELVLKLAHAVHYAHGQGILHRDLKPANVLLDERGEPKLTDFGLTKTTADQTQTMVSAGSPHYMAPEQASRERGPTGVHTDVFGIGAILYFLLTGRPPFNGELLGETLRAVLEQEPEPPRSLRRDTPPDLETICLKCLRKAPAERYATAADVADDLERFLRLEPIQARRIGAVGRFVRWSRRNPALAGLMLTALAAFVAVTFQWRRAIAGEYVARQNAYAAQMLLAQQRYESFNVGGALDLLDELRPGQGGSVFPGFEWGFLYRLCHQERRIIPVERRDVHVLAFSPSGKYLAAAMSEYGHVGTVLQLFDPQSGQKITNFTAGERRFAFSPDEKFIATAQGAAVRIREFPKGTVLQTISASTAPVTALAISPDSRLLAFGGADRELHLWDLTQNKLMHSLPANTNRGVFSIAWNPSGSVVACGGDDGVAFVFDASSGRERHVLRGHSEFIYSLAFSPDDQLLATSSGDNRIILWDPATGQATGELKGHSSTIYSIAFSPDGRKLASAGWDNTVRLWDLEKKIEARIFRGTRSFAYSVAFSPDGKILASGGHDRSIRLWDAEGSPTHLEFDSPGSTMLYAELSRNGKWLVTRDGGDGKTDVGRLWDVGNGRELRAWQAVQRHLVYFVPSDDRLLLHSSENAVALYQPGETNSLDVLPFPPNSYICTSFSPDGQRVATSDAKGEARLYRNPPETPLLTVSIPRLKSGGDVTVQFCPNSRWFVATGSDKRIHIWDALSGKEHISVSRPGVRQRPLVISPDSKLISAIDEDGYNLWEVESGKRRFSGSGIASIECADRFSPDSKSILVGHGDTFYLRDTRDGTIRFALRGHHGSALASAFSPDGRRIATAGNDHQIKIWDAANGRELLSIVGHKSSVFHVAFSADGRRLISCGRDGTTKIWTAASDREIAEWKAQDLAVAHQREALAERTDLDQVANP